MALCLTLRLLYMRLTSVLPLLLAAASLSLGGCTKENDKAAAASPARLEVRLVDAPGSFKAVTLDVQKVQTGDDTAGWTDFATTHAGLYDVMQLVNGRSAVLASADLPAGPVPQVRLVLGPHSTVTLGNGEVKPLVLPNGQAAGLKVRVDARLVPGAPCSLTLDFDVAKSIAARSDGAYGLAPVLRALATAVGGGIKGAVVPAQQLMVRATGGGAVADTVHTFSDTEGNFLLANLPAGSYRVDFVSASQAVFRAGVVVGSQVTDLGAVAVAPDPVAPAPRDSTRSGSGG